MTVRELSQRLCGRMRDVNPDSEVSGFATDSREVFKGDAFLAIRGQQVDGHDYVAQIANTASVSVVEMPVPYPRIEVESIVPALARFGKSLRSEFCGPVVGITGSNGKTSTKEFVAAALAPAGSVLKTEGNRNTEYTSPLLWSRLTSEHKSVVVEMGMRGFGQIAHLADIASPTIGVITNIGTAHVELVGSREGIAKAKGELLERLVGPAVSVLWREDEYLDRLKEYALGQVVTFGSTEGSDVRLVGYRATTVQSSSVSATVFGAKVQFELSTIGKHQALNACAALAVGVLCGVEANKAAEALVQAQLPPMRMQSVQFEGVSVLFDAYNASPDSTVSALRTLCEVPCSGRRIAVLGEMRELGSFSESGHRRVGRELAMSCLDNVLLIGELTNYVRDEAVKSGFDPSKIRFIEEVDYPAITEFIRHASTVDMVLIKGSRALHLERSIDGVKV